MQDSQGGRFATADGAAKAAMMRYNDKSIRDNVEYGGLVYKTPDGKYDFTKATRGEKDTVNPWGPTAKSIPKCAQEVGYWHTHGDHSGSIRESHNAGQGLLRKQQLLSRRQGRRQSRNAT